MAAGTIIGQIQEGHIQMGQNGRYVQWLRWTWNSTDLTCTLPVRGTKIEAAFFTQEGSAANYCSYTQPSNGTTTITRGVGTSGATWSGFIIIG